MEVEVWVEVELIDKVDDEELVAVIEEVPVGLSVWVEDEEELCVAVAVAVAVDEAVRLFKVQDVASEVGE